jgi:hypothetical protein
MLSRERGARFGGNLLAPGNQARTAAAADDLAGERLKVGRAGGGRVRGRVRVGRVRASAGSALRASTALRRSAAHAGPVPSGAAMSPWLPTKPILTLAAMALSALALGACGTTVSTSGYKGEAEAVAQRVANFESNVTASEAAKICSEDLSAVVKAKLKAAGGDCEGALKSQLKQIDVPELTIHSIEVKGPAAKARVRSTWSGKTAESTLVLVKEGSDWRIATLQ